MFHEISINCFVLYAELTTQNAQKLEYFSKYIRNLRFKLFNSMILIEDLRKTNILIHFLNHYR